MQTNWLTALCFLSLAACGGGSEQALEATVADTGVTVFPSTSLPLSGSIEAGGIVFSGTPSLVEDPSTQISIASDYRVTISTDEGELASFGPGDEVAPIAGGIMTFSTNGGREGLLFNKPFNPSDPATFSRGFDYVTFGVWLTGASEDFASATGFYDITDAGVLVAGNVTQSELLPQFGSATYVGDAVGLLADCLIVEDILHGNVVINADFDLRLVETTISLDHSDGAAWGTIQSGVTEILAGNATFDALSATSDRNMEGHVHGFFAGPTGEEIGGQFHLDEAGTERRVIGSFAAFDAGREID